MLIAQEKRATNVAEYVLYMWQVEDLIRSCAMDIDNIYYNIIHHFEEPDQIKEAVKQWYLDLIEEMQIQSIAESGHLAEVRDTIEQMFQLHNNLINVFQDKEYLQACKTAAPNLQLMHQKSGGSNMNDIEICLNALYGLWMMRLQKKEITEETEEGLQTFSNLLALLSVRFQQMEQGELELNPEINN